VPRVIHFHEVEVAELTNLADVLTVELQWHVWGFIKLLLVAPAGCRGPGFSSAPVAGPVFVAVVNENFYVAVVENINDVGHLGHWRVLFVEEFMDVPFAHLPLSTYTENFLDVLTIEELFRLAEVVAQRLIFTRESDVKHVPLISSEAFVEIGALFEGFLGEFHVLALLGLR